MLNSQQHMAGLVYQNGLPEGCKSIRRNSQEGGRAPLGHQLPLNEYEGFGPLDLHKELDQPSTLLSDPALTF